MREFEQVLRIMIELGKKQATVTIPAGKKKENAGDLDIHIGM